ncbi:hypothetical protein [Cellulosimicrobium arenosum]|uniref:Uncharacterized protein n=1 Tax=Cellulosimicrobium arenosum TaxID=2708133 RepID=A0A927G9R2_9MICO|nr:hypothetical protein [Cellulosimicrobium arenosum]MBD8079114.1 hypothetical protein [Cellulosimicrobium arenosum]
MDNLGAALGALVPSIGVGLLFWLAMRAIVRADRNERAALARLDAQEAAASGIAENSGPTTSGHA